MSRSATSRLELHCLLTYYQCMWLGITRLLYGGHDILVFITYAQKPPLKAYADVSRGARVLNFGLRLFLTPYFSIREMKALL